MRIIAVDDESLALEGLSDAIGRAAPAAELKTFRDSDEAILWAERQGADVAFLDIELRGENGVSVAKKLKALNPRINIIFVTGYSEYMQDAFRLYASGYVLKPVMAEQVKSELENLRFPVSAPAAIVARTFGAFDLLCNGRPLKFTYRKSKELLAVLVDAVGAPCSLGKITEMLWEHDLSDKSSYLRNLVADIRRVLRQCGCPELLQHRYNELFIQPSLLICDYFAFLAGAEAALDAFQGEYMSQYSWAENTLGELLRKQQEKKI